MSGPVRIIAGSTARIASAKALFIGIARRSPIRKLLEIQAGLVANTPVPDTLGLADVGVGNQLRRLGR